MDAGLKISKNLMMFLYVGNSGTTIRLLAGILASAGFNCVLSGDSSINKRPMGGYLNPFLKWARLFTAGKQFKSADYNYWKQHTERQVF